LGVFLLLRLFESITQEVQFDDHGVMDQTIGRNRVDDKGTGTLSGVDADIVFAIPFVEKRQLPAIVANSQTGTSPMPINSRQPRPGPASSLARRPGVSSPPIGAPLGTAFEDSAPPGGYLVGLRVIKGSNWGGVVHAIQPIYRVGNEAHEGRLLGGMDDKGRSEAIAKPGYAVGGIQARRGAVIDSIKLTFYRIKGNKMDPADNYESEWLGGSGGTGRSSVEFGGSFLVGISGTLQGDITSLRFQIGQP
jgi:hypothetical protein